MENIILVEEGLYRSAQPDRADMLELERIGIRTVLNLRRFHDDEDEAEGTGLRLLTVPINTWDISVEEVIAALRILANKSHRPLLVHCLHGADRTGTVIAMYRIVFQKWTKEQALKELTEGGFGYHALWKNIPRFIKAADIEAIRQEVFLQE